MKELVPRPDFKTIEAKWQTYWEKNKLYRFDPKSKKPVYSIDTPPPYASAEHLHIGHAMNYTQLEIMARFKRMAGFNVYFPPCFDNNGMPTERYVEKKFNINKGSMSRSKFISLCREEASKVEKNYAEKFFSALGHSHDWNLLYTTIDSESQKVAQTAFLELVKKGFAYRAEEPTLWCPHCQTALAQAEVESSSRDTKLNWIYFELNNKKIEIATTRPEFLPATVAIFVNPGDERYKKYIRKTVKVPLFNLKVPVLTDEAVDPKFGSGIMMVCTFGDKEDIDKWKRHKLNTLIILNKDGTLNELTGKYNGLDLKTARAAIIDDLEGLGYFIRDEPLEQEVGVCWRCGTPIEFLITKQWFLNVLDHKKKIIAAGRKVKWYPKYMRNRLEDWTNNLNWDWCISRQRFYGVPIPVWYCQQCEKPVFPSKKDLPVDPTSSKLKLKCVCGNKNLISEKDVFDTWMTSSQTPQIALRWLEKPKQYKKLFPTTLRPQSQDIIRTWAFYTIYKSYALFDSIPWKDIMISPFVLDPKGKGMSKSKGNAIWLPDILEKYNADTVRYWVSTGGLGGDMLFKEQELARGYKLLIKLWNTARFVSMHFKAIPKKSKLEIIDEWILSRLAETQKKYISYFERYDIAKARKEVELFFLHEFCDFYLEMIKYRIYGEDKKSKEAAQATLYTCLLAILKMFAPIIPHITEELYSALFKKAEKEKSIHLSQLGKAGNIDRKALEQGKIACEIISEIRKWKQKRNLSLGAEVEKLTVNYPKSLKDIKDVIKGTMRIKELKVKTRRSRAPRAFARAKEGKLSIN